MTNFRDTEVSQGWRLEKKQQQIDTWESARSSSDSALKAKLSVSDSKILN